MAEPRTKKTNLACDSCRRRKRKCDGRTPICSLCEKGNIECVYDATLDQRRPAQKNYVAALEARVALLEGILRDAGASDVPESSEVAPVDDSVDPTPQQTRAASPVAPPTTSTDAVPQPDLSAEPRYVPADGAAEALKLMAEPQVQQDPVAVTEELDLGMEDCVPLVSFETEHQLLAQFWDWQRMHLPYVAPVPFLSAYAIYSEAVHPDEPIPPPPPPPPPNPFAGPTAIGVPRAAEVPVTPDLPHFISPLLLDCMFAVAALFHGNSETSQLFYERAKPKMLEEVAKPRLATVQAVLLMATWELGHARAPAAWTLSGVAVALCVRLGMNIDASPLVRSGGMSKRLFETRNFVFWATYNFDRFYATCMGMHPLMDRRIISTPRHSSLATANVADGGKPIEATPSASALSGPKSLGAPPDKPTASDVAVSWWSPGTLGMGDVLVQAAWEAVRDLLRITDMLFDGIYAFNAPKRTPQENLELVTRNNLAIQRFLDGLPTWLRSTGAIRRKDNGLVYLHLCVHLTSVLACRPFLSERPHPEEPSRTDPTISSSQPTQSSQITRRYRTLAFRVARASALQVMSLIRHIPLSSPCVTLPYIVYSASTILLLCPDDLAAMDGVRTGIACLDAMNETGYWIESARDASDRIKALARRWGVVIAPSKRVLGPIETTSGAGGGGSGSGGAGGSGSGAGNQDSSDQGSGAPGSSNEASSNLPSNVGSGAGSTATTRPAMSAGMAHAPEDHAPYAAQHPPSMVPDIPTGYQEVPAASDHVDVLSRLYATQIRTGELVPDQNQIYPDPSQPQDVTISLPLLGVNSLQGYPRAEPQDYPSTDHTQNYISAPSAQIPEQYHNTAFTHSSGAIQPAHQRTGNHTYNSAQQPTQFTTQIRTGDAQSYSQPLGDIQSYLQSESTSHASHLQYARDPLAARRRQELQRQQQSEQSQYRQASSSRAQAHPYHRPPQPKARKIPHVAYALSHAKPEHDLHLPHTHWHAVLPADPTLPFPPDPTACMDLAACFSHTVEHTQDPAFLDSGPDPFASVAIDWLADSSCSFPAMTLDMYAGSTMTEGQTVYAREAGDPYGGGYSEHEHGGGYGGGYGGSGVGM